MEALGLLAGGVAHDLNNVLSEIVGYPDFLLTSLPIDSSLRKPLTTIRDSGAKAATIVQDLLALARRGIVNYDVVNLNHDRHFPVQIALRATSEPAKNISKILSN